MDAIDVGAKPCAGLRTTSRDQVAYLQATQWIHIGGSVGAEQLPRLREDVIGEVVAGVLERLVSSRVVGLQRWKRTHSGERVVRTPFQTDDLSGNAHDCEPVLDQFRGSGAVEKALAGGDVVPFDEHATVEVSGIPGAHHEHPSTERLLVAGSTFQRPSFGYSLASASRTN